MTNSKRMPNFVGLRHVGLSAKDPTAVVAFYRDVLGMTLVRQTAADSPIGNTVFFSRHPEGEEDHDLVIFPDPMFAHIAFEVASLAELKRSYQEVKEKVPIKYIFNHGIALSFYFDDPEGHNIEIYWTTTPDYRIRKRISGTRLLAQPIDLDLSEKELMREVKRTLDVMASDAGSQRQPETSPVEQQRQVISKRAGPQWTKEAESELDKIPSFVRNRAKEGVEKYAREQGITEITPEVLQKARKAAGMG
jgi:catechol 2,3-dioxygenase-like lactoylglutathione lyase family enzyme